MGCVQVGTQVMSHMALILVQQKAARWVLFVIFIALQAWEHHYIFLLSMSSVVFSDGMTANIARLHALLGRLGRMARVVHTIFYVIDEQSSRFGAAVGNIDGLGLSPFLSLLCWTNPRSTVYVVIKVSNPNSSLWYLLSASIVQ